MLNFFVVVAVLLGAVALLLGAVLLFKKYGWPMQYLWAIPVIVLIGFGVWWGISSLGSSTPPKTPSSSGWSLEAPSLKTVWEWTKNHWLWIVLILVILLFLPSVFAKTWLKPLPWLAAITAFMLFVLFPVLVGIQGDENPNSHQRSEIPLASSPQSTWPKLVIPPGIGSESELIHVPPGTQLSIAGYKFRLYNVYQDKTRCAYGNDCKIAPLAGTIAVNESADENIIHYAYSKT